MSADRGPTRRGFLALAGSSAAAAALTGCGVGGTEASAAAPPVVDAVARVPADGRRQAGVELPARPQTHQLTVVADLKRAPGPVLAALGRRILALTSGTDPHLAGMDPGDLTVTVGIGPRLVQRGLPGAAALPTFSRERLTDTGNGDLLLQICAADPTLLPIVAAALHDGAISERWRQLAFRGPVGTVGAPRNLLGFADGLVNPRTTTDFDADVWLSGPGSVTDGTIAVVRRIEIDVAKFLALPVQRQEAVFGRRRDTAGPLSGGAADAVVDLQAKTPAGAYLIPADAHVRRAHPGATGVPTMFRRGYSFADSNASGLLFVSFQNALSTFVRTMNRMSTMDALLEYTRTTHSGTFLVLPGFSVAQPLGSTLFT